MFLAHKKLQIIYLLSTNVCFETELSLTKCSRSNRNIRFIDLNSILLCRIVSNICVIENNFQNRFSQIQMQQKMNNIQKCILTKKTKTKQQQTNRNKNKTPKYLYIVVIHHYLLYLKKKVFTFLIVAKHLRLLIDHLQ